MITTHDSPSEVRARAKTALTRADSFLAAAERELPRLARDLRGDQRTARMGSLANLLQGLASVTRLVTELHRMGLPQSPGTDLVRLTGSLRQLVTRQESGDWHGAADALDSHLAPLLPEWRDALSRHARLLHAEPDPTAGP